MTENATLRQLVGLPDQPAAMADSTLIMIDCQNTYTKGVLELEGVQPALDQAAELLDRARSARIPIVHIMHDAGEGSPYDVRDEIGQIVDRVAPCEGKLVIVKTFPNAFTRCHPVHDLADLVPHVVRRALSGVVHDVHDRYPS